MKPKKKKQSNPYSTTSGGDLLYADNNMQRPALNYTDDAQRTRVRKKVRDTMGALRQTGKSWSEAYDAVKSGSVVSLPPKRQANPVLKGKVSYKGIGKKKR